MAATPSTARRAARVAGAAAAGLSVLWMAFVGLGPHTGRYRTLTVLTGSMDPAIAPGSLVVVTPKPADRLRVGDVLTYTAPTPDRPTVTHRVVEVRPGERGPVVRTQGDANAAPDPWRAELSEGPVWTVQAAVPHAGRVVRALQAPPVRRATVWLAPMVLAVLWLADIWRPRRGAAVAPPPPPAIPARRPGPVTVGVALGLVLVVAAGRRRRPQGLAA